MTVLEWDVAGDRRWETGIDRGVLYHPLGPAFPWNGLTGITETLEREVKSYYLDGVKYLDHHVPGSYEAKLQAFTYPDELDELIGNLQFAPGVFLHDQRPKTFSLAYRTREGNDLDSDAGYKLHLVYNVLANPSSVQFSTLQSSVTAGVFEWTLTGTPKQMFGVRPTSHLSLYSRTIDPTLLATIEDMIYGTEEVDAALPDLVDLLDIIQAAS